MNRVLVNSAAFNGRALAGVLLASVVLTGAATATALGAYVRPASVAVAGVGTVRVAATRVRPGTSAAVARAVLVGRATNRQTAFAVLPGTAVARAAVRRAVAGAVEFASHAGLTAIPAGTLGTATAQGAATLMGAATRQQYPRAVAEAVASLGGLAQVIRGGVAVLSGAATLYAEEGQRYCATWADWVAWDDGATWAEFDCYAVYSAYTRPVGQAALGVRPVRVVRPTAVVLGTAQVTAEGFASRNIYQYAVVLTPTLAALSGTASKTMRIEAAPVAVAAVTAGATRRVNPAAVLLARAGVGGVSYQVHAGALALSGRAALSAHGVRQQSAQARLSAPATLAARGVRTLVPRGALAGTAGLVAVTMHFPRFGAAQITAAAQLMASTWTLAQASLPGAATLAGRPVRTTLGQGALLAGGAMTPMGQRVARPQTQALATAVLRAFGFTNIVDDDPSTEVLVRPAPTTDFRRPLGTTDFVRSA